MLLTALLLGLAPGLSATSDQPIVENNSLLPYAISFAEDGAQEANWVGSVLLSLVDTRGNTKNQSAALDVNAVLLQGTNRHTAKAYWLYSDNEGVLTERKAGASWQYDYLAGEDYYYTTSAALETDDRADLDLRYRLGAGFGYDVVKGDATQFSVEAGLNYISESFSDGSDNSVVAVNLGYDLDYAINDKAKFTQSFDIYPAIDDLKDVYARLESRITHRLSGTMEAAISSVFDWDNTPAAGAERRDHRLMISLGWSFGG